MSVIGSNILAGASGQGGDYTIARSLRLRSSASAYLNRTPASAGNRKTWTWSAWVKRGTLSTDQQIFSGRSGTPDWTGLFFVSSNALEMTFAAGSAGGTVTTQVFRDPSAWYHIVVAVDTTQATASNRLKIYVNGVQVTSFSSTNYPSLNFDTQINNTVVHKLGDNDYKFDGYLAEVNFIDGQALTPSSFGATNPSTGVWQPKKYAGTYGTNGFYLPFSDNSALTTSSNAGLGKDFSGNGNYWTTNNISITAGSTYDSMTDVPTLTSATASNFATLNPLARHANTSSTLSSANLNSSGNGATYTPAVSTIAVTTGKWYFEGTVVSTSDAVGVGIMEASTYISANSPWATGNNYHILSNGQKYSNNANNGSSGIGGFTTGDVISLNFDADTGTLKAQKNNGTEVTIYSSIPSGSYLFSVSGFATNDTMAANFGQRPFAYTPPTGFVALNTFNLPTPTIGATASTQANKYFDISLYTGNSSSQTVTNEGGFSPDLVWVKSRNVGGNNHNLWDSVRGAGKALISNLTDSEYTANNMTGFVSNGFSFSGVAMDSNTTGNNLVAWQWRGSDSSAVTNTAGSITSTVSANTSAGFSVVTYTGNGSAGATVGHGLGVTPAMFIIKRRDGGANNWRVYHRNMAASPATGTLYLSLTDGFTVDSTEYNNTPPTSSVFSLGTQNAVNGSGGTFVAYCFSEVAGYSKFGSYTGSGNTNDNTFVYCGFRPRFVMIKRVGSLGDWIIRDTSRDTSNVDETMLLANASDAESTTSYTLDILSNGFKLRHYSFAMSNTETYIYAAFAEAPTKFALAR